MQYPIFEWVSIEYAIDIFCFCLTRCVCDDIAAPLVESLLKVGRRCHQSLHISITTFGILQGQTPLTYLSLSFLGHVESWMFLSYGPVPHLLHTISFPDLHSIQVFMIDHPLSVFLHAVESLYWSGISASACCLIYLLPIHWTQIPSVDQNLHVLSIMEDCCKTEKIHEKYHRVPHSFPLWPHMKA